MSVTQTSKIQIRSGNLADLPQLSVGELGWAVDEKRLFIGNDSNSFTLLPQNTEVLTVFSNLPPGGTSSNISSGTSSVSIPTVNGNVNTSVGGNANVFVVTGTGANVAGTFDVTSNLSSGNLTSGNITSGNLASGNITSSNITTGNLTSGNITTGNLSTTGDLSATNVTYTGILTGSTGVIDLLTTTTVQTIDLTTGGSTVAGNITGNWSLTPGSRIQSTYADLAERYSSDENYPPGTVMMIGGTRETTIATHSGRTQLAGIVSSEPAYIMNSVMKDSVVIALIGRVPCKVVGTISKGDLLTISDIPGVATSTNQPECGTIIGRALEPYNSDSVGMIEVKVDRA